MNRELLIVNDDSLIKHLREEVAELKKMIVELLHEKQKIGDWINEEHTMKLTTLGKTSLAKLRNAGKVRSSNLTERVIFYRLSDLEKLLDKNQN